MRMMFTMKANESQREIYVKINEESQRKASQFKVVLLSEHERTQLEGIDSCTTVSILDNANTGVVGFESSMVYATPEQQKVKVLLKRMNGANGQVDCRISTSLSRHQGEELSLEQSVVFADCQVEATVEVEIPSFKDEEAGTIQLELASEQAELSSTKCVVQIAPEEKDEKVVALRASLEKFVNQTSELTYAQQFKQAANLDSENAEEVSTTEAFVQYAVMPWKLAMAFIPPSSYVNGWMRAACALAAVGAISFLILEITTTVGCIFDMRSTVQALVLVAIGTSLPDLATSRRAAESKRTKDADASISTLAGANAASVFIGLGLPWTIATVYHWAQYGESFFVGKLPTADITFALVLFLACSVICFMVLGLRRLIIGGELGGPKVSRVFSAIVMFFLWGAFITLNIMNSYGYLGAARDIFVPSVAINANQHLTSDWKAPIVEEKLVNGRPGIKVRWTSPAKSDACQVQFYLGEFIGNFNGGDAWFPDPNCQCDKNSVVEQSCELTFNQLQNDYNAKSCAPIKVRVRSASSIAGNTWGQPSPENNNVPAIKLKGGCPILTLSSSNPFNTVSWTALDQTCYSNVNANSY